MTFSSNRSDSSKFESFVLSCIDNRIEELSNEYSNSAEYSEFYHMYNDILRKLEQISTKETYALILQLEAVYEKLSVDYQNFFYCRMLFNLLRKWYSIKIFLLYDE